MSLGEYFETLKTKSTGEKGIAFEKICKKYLTTLYDEVYFYDEFVLIHKEFPSSDCGADLMCKNKKDLFRIPVQCKFRSDQKKGISQRDVSTLFSFREKMKKYLNKKSIIMTTTNKKAKFFNDCVDVEFIFYDTLKNVSVEDIDIDIDMVKDHKKMSDQNIIIEKKIEVLNERIKKCIIQ